MFSTLAKLLSSIASFLFPLFASYKALKTSDPAQLTPWLMYWVVLACALLVESWTEWILVWIPFYPYIRLLFLLYLVLPQTQGARLLYQEHIHPYLEENEAQIEEFIASAHDRLKAAGIASLKRTIELLKTNLLGLPADPTPAAAPEPLPGQTYTQALLARFSLPAARWVGYGTGTAGAGASPAAAANAGADFYTFLANAVSALAGGQAGGADAAPPTLVPPTLRTAPERMSFIDAQRQRLGQVLTALEREARDLERAEALRRSSAPRTPAADAAADLERPASGLSRRSRSEADFEKIDAESGAEDDAGRRRGASGGSWLAWAWGANGEEAPAEEADGPAAGTSTSVDTAH